MTSTTLYERLGGERGIAELVEDIVAAHMQNPRIQARFLPYREDPARLEEVKGHLRDFLSAGSGGPHEYRGRSMPEAHRGMNIDEAEYMAALDDILAALDRHGIDPQTRLEVLGIAYSLKEEILHV
ncbi:group I truncated hemoglobin [Halomonas koreensis]|uniref:Group 1 truncated hemoglobin n=1 Tax=Halomonas koreensis TaxID=245385 RepID=A0ABU1FZP3_9GAMM|nr:group 1 truncated hemoglobin [Halomonas koreensis]MDR5866159.1 group 1 truncated hemoglobin [Halomonas koreensis]